MTPDTFYARATQALLALSPEERAKCYCQHNNWQWPVQLESLKPDGWDDLPETDCNKAKFDHPDGRTLMRVIDLTTSEFDRSRQWWIDVCGKTQEQHLEWWLSDRKSAIPMP